MIAATYFFYIVIYYRMKIYEDIQVKNFLLSYLKKTLLSYNQLYKQNISLHVFDINIARAD